MKLKLLNETRTTPYFKCLRPPQYKKFKQTKIPGYVGTPYLATCYISIGHEFEPVNIIAIPIDLTQVKDMSHLVDDMCSETWRTQHPELLTDIWTAWGSAHGNQQNAGVYCGQPVPHKDITHIPNRQAYNSIGGNTPQEIFNNWRTYLEQTARKITF